jgi:hypothetical protein
VATRVEFKVKGKKVQMVMTMDRMHNEERSERARMGMEGQPEKLNGVFGAK